MIKRFDTLPSGGCVRERKLLMSNNDYDRINIDDKNSLEECSWQEMIPYCNEHYIQWDETLNKQLKEKIHADLKSLDHDLKQNAIKYFKHDYVFDDKTAFRQLIDRSRNFYNDLYHITCRPIENQVVYRGTKLNDTIPGFRSIYDLKKEMPEFDVASYMHAGLGKTEMDEPFNTHLFDSYLYTGYLHEGDDNNPIDRELKGFVAYKLLENFEYLRPYQAEYVKDYVYENHSKHFDHIGENGTKQFNVEKARDYIIHGNRMLLSADVSKDDEIFGVYRSDYDTMYSFLDRIENRQPIIKEYCDYLVGKIDQELWDELCNEPSYQQDYKDLHGTIVSEIADMPRELVKQCVGDPRSDKLEDLSIIKSDGDKTFVSLPYERLEYFNEKLYRDCVEDDVLNPDSSLFSDPRTVKYAINSEGVKRYGSNKQSDVKSKPLDSRFSKFEEIANQAHSDEDSLEL